MTYTHGGDIYGDNHVIFDFSVNTNPLGMPEEVRQAVMERSDSWAVYPDSRGRELKRRLSDYYTEKDKENTFLPEDFLCGNGAADLLYSLLFALRPLKALVFAPSFGEYEKALQAAGCEVKKHYLEEKNGFSMELPEDRLKEVFAQDLDMVILGNPNNPTGTAVSVEILREWAEICLEKHIMLVVDECFNWFLEEGESCSSVSLLSKYPNLIVINAFTKIYAMAGLRLGYLICKNREVIARMESCRQPWSVSAPATAAGIKAIGMTDFPIRTRRLVAVEREFLKTGLEKRGFKVYPSQVNYLLFCKKDGVDYFRLCLEKGLLIRRCESFDGLDRTFYRVSVKTHEENEALLRVLSAAGQDICPRL